MNNPSLVLTFLGNDLEAGHSTTQTISNQWLVNHSYQPSKQLLNGLKSSSDQIALTIFRKCPSVEDIIATEGNIKAVLKDGDTVVFTGFLSTNHNFVVTDHGEQALAITIESIGTRLFSQPFIETGYHFFDSQASAAVFAMINPLGLSFREGDERKILQPIRREVEAGKTVRELMDSLFYECNAVYWFNNLGELCVEPINPSTSGASVVDSAHLFNLNGKAISLSKSLRTYKGARVRYTETAEASNYLVYRNTTGADDSHPYCNLKLGAGEWYDGGEIYTNAEWSAATADQFREPLLISAVNAGSETEIVGSGKIVAISNARQKVTADLGITVQIEAVGGKWFKITCHNTSGVDKYITRLDLYADIVYEKTQGIIRTQIDGSTEGKSLLEEELSWIHDKNNAQRHGNLLAQYYKNCGATYTFYSDLTITLGSVIRLIDDTFSGLDVYVLVYASKGQTASELIEYRAVGISTFNLNADVFHGTQSIGNQSAAQGAQGEAGESAQVQYALGNSPTTPPSEKMLWSDADMEWNGEDMIWEAVIYSDTVPVPSEGQYVWMRTRVGDTPWQYMRLTGEEGEDAKVWDFLMSAMTYTVDHRKTGNNPAVTLKADIQGYTITPSWEVRDASNNDRSSWLSGTTGSPVTLNIPYDNAAPWPLTVKMKATGMPTVEKSLSGMDVTTYSYDIGVWSGASLPQYIDYPTNTKKVASGDYFVAGAEFTVSGVTYKAGYAYYYNGSTWTGLDLSDQENAKKALNLLSDLSSADIQIPSSNEVYSVWLWAKNFVAQNAVIQNLFAEKITVLDDGCIHSDYYDDAGNPQPKYTVTVATSSSAWSALIDEEMWFASDARKVAGTYKWVCDDSNDYWDSQSDNPFSSASTSNMYAYFGISISGVYGRYSELTVTVSVAADNGFWLGANGMLKAANALISGAITAKTFSFDNVGMKWGYFEFNSTTNIDLETNYGVTQGDLVTVQAGWMGSDEPFANPNFSILLDDGARTVSLETPLVNSNGVQISYVRGVYGISYGLRVVTSKAIRLFIQAFHKNS